MFLDEFCGFPFYLTSRSMEKRLNDERRFAAFVRHFEGKMRGQLREKRLHVVRLAAAHKNQQKSQIERPALRRFFLVEQKFFTTRSKRFEKIRRRTEDVGPTRPIDYRKF